ncbi:hypothetical protein LCGC14_1302380 [marine sediment metagenome]|uniref:Uncharacterized protein n=1 Tax=marine sediment metagenome TaxID=412755 RepID=A0A0F9L9U1_9ZZZZ
MKIKVRKVMLIALVSLLLLSGGAVAAKENLRLAHLITEALPFAQEEAPVSLPIMSTELETSTPFVWATPEETIAPISIGTPASDTVYLSQSILAETLADAVQVARAGDIIWIGEGTIATRAGRTAVVVDKALTFVGDGMESTILDGGLLILSSTVTIRDLTVSDIEVRGGKSKFTASNIKAGAIHADNTGAIEITNSQIASLDIRLDGPRSVIVSDNAIGIPWQGRSRSSAMSGGRVEIKRNRVYSQLDIVGDGYVIQDNVFEEEAFFLVKAGSRHVIENNDFLRGLGQVRDDGIGTMWQGNYWANWDVSKPIPIAGDAKAVARTPALKAYDLGSQ